MSKGKVTKQGAPSEILPDLEDYLLSSDLADSDFEAAPITGLPKSPDEIADADKDTLLDEEIAEKGTVRFGVYSAYMSAIGRYLAISIFLSMLTMQCSRNFTDLWLSFWVTHANDTSTNSTNSSDLPNVLRLQAAVENDNGVGYYLKIYAILGLINSVFTLIRAFMFAYGGIQAALSMHKQLLKIVMKVSLIEKQRNLFFLQHSSSFLFNVRSGQQKDSLSWPKNKVSTKICHDFQNYTNNKQKKYFLSDPNAANFVFYFNYSQLLTIFTSILQARTTFFNLHPLGRILNRFSSDTYTIDDSLPFIANILLAQSFALLGSIVVTAYSLPWIFLLLAPLAPIYHWAQQHYRYFQKEPTFTLEKSANLWKEWFFEI